MRRVVPTLSHGFTLVELMVTVAIVGILAAVAYPLYTAFVAKGNRAEGRAAVMKMLQDQERFFTQRNTYIELTTAEGAQLKNFSGDSRATSKYFISTAACTGSTISQCVLVTAVPQFRGGDPEVGSLTGTSAGARGCTGSKPQLCWPS
jgi:type IV pilus assembly protein PilE